MLQAWILTRGKKAIRKDVDSKRGDYEFRKSVYILDPTRVQNYQNSNGAIEGQQLLFFEDNPNPLTSTVDPITKKPKDLSEEYLEDVVLINFIQQTTDTFGKWNMPSFGFLSWFTANPTRIPFALMLMAIAYTLIADYLGVA